MCGIVGIVGKNSASPLLLECLKRLEYRGYDSAGIAILEGGRIDRYRAEGKIVNLEAVVSKSNPQGLVGIGHTRWATHGVPSERNAHPHATDQVAVVHNGIIENFRELREMLEKKGHTFTSETDTEVIAHLVTDYLNQGESPKTATQKTLQQLHGAFALALLFKDKPDTIFCARRGSPLAIGLGDDEMFLGSDALALAPLTQKICYLEEGDWAEIGKTTFTLYDETNQIVTRPIKQTALTGAMIGKGDYKHFMLKEILEQPAVMGDVLHAYSNPHTMDFAFPDLPIPIDAISSLRIIACGTSYYAGLTAQYWLEQYAKIPTSVDIASEFRYRKPPLPKNGVALFISQSGETADTLAALQYAKEQGQVIIGMVNVPESSIARLSDVVLETHAGPEIGVASTKAFTAQLMVLGCLSLHLANKKSLINDQDKKDLFQALLSIPEIMTHVLSDDGSFVQCAEFLVNARDVIYMGRGTSFAIAMEGALKLKELSYIHAEGYAAGEMKHGPIALIDEKVPVIVVAPSDGLYEKTASNVEEVIARKGQVVFIGDKDGIHPFKEKAVMTLEMPKVHAFTSPLLYALPMQMIAYHTATLKGTDVDQPRNLAKSVTVE
jgi:glucosamine--fructose-6-phosphate aminotransferase (isomerizing)